MSYDKDHIENLECLLLLCSFVSKSVLRADASKLVNQDLEFAGNLIMKVNQIEELERIIKEHSDKQVFVGDVGVRDPEFRCEEFEPGKPSGSECFGDGHYLCQECIHLVPEKVEDE
jgi:hypothetical protein